MADKGFSSSLKFVHENGIPYKEMRLFVINELFVEHRDGSERKEFYTVRLSLCKNKPSMKE